MTEKNDSPQDGSAQDGSSQDELGTLWQSQSVAELDHVSIEKQAKSQRLKQRFYMLLDVMSLLPIALYFYLDIQVPTTLHIFILLMMAIAILTILYFAKLRWHSMVMSQVDTKQYTHLLHQQLKNNARIAFLNKHFGWVVLLLLTAAFLINGISTQASVGKTLKDIFLGLGLGLAMAVPWMFWAHKRQRRFEKEAEQLQLQIEENNL